MAAASPQPRPASFTCTFLATGKPGPVEIAVTSRQAGKRAHALTAAMTQDGAPIMDAIAWFVAEGMAGFEHDVATMPTVPPAAALRGFQDLADNYAEWYPLWRNVEGRPLVWDQAIARRSIRSGCGCCSRSARRSGARSRAPTDVARRDHVERGAAAATAGRRSISPRSLDLTAQFHRGDPQAEWLFGDAAAPIAGSGLAACNARIWSPSGQLLASGTSHLFCRPNPEAA
jgi:acyl-CoA thioesterase